MKHELQSLPDTLRASQNAIFVALAPVAELACELNSSYRIPRRSGPAPVGPPPAIPAHALKRPPAEDTHLRRTSARLPAASSAQQTPAKPEFRIIVKTLFTSVYTLSVRSDTTMAHLKEAIEDLSNAPCDQQRLVFSGRLLPDEENMTMCGVARDSCVFLVIRRRGN